MTSRRPRPKDRLTKLNPDVLHEVIRLLPFWDRRALRLTSRRLCEAITPTLFGQVYLSSSYRLSQLVHGLQVRHPRISTSIPVGAGLAAVVKTLVVAAFSSNPKQHQHEVSWDEQLATLRSIVELLALLPNLIALQDARSSYSTVYESYADYPLLDAFSRPMRGFHAGDARWGALALRRLLIECPSLERVAMEVMDMPEWLPVVPNAAQLTHLDLACLEAETVRDIVALSGRWLAVLKLDWSGHDIGYLEDNAEHRPINRDVLEATLRTVAGTLRELTVRQYRWVWAAQEAFVFLLGGTLPHLEKLELKEEWSRDLADSQPRPRRPMTAQAPVGVVGGLINTSSRAPSIAHRTIGPAVAPAPEEEDSDDDSSDEEVETTVPLDFRVPWLSTPNTTLRILHLRRIVSFPAATIYALFASGALPAVRSLSAHWEPGSRWADGAAARRARRKLWMIERLKWCDVRQEGEAMWFEKVSGRLSGEQKEAAFFDWTGIGVKQTSSDLLL